MKAEKTINQIKSTLRALRSKNYRLFFFGQGVSLMGTWMQSTAMSWLVYRLTDSAMILGLIGFTTQFPMFLFTPIAGVYADRLNRYRLVVATQCFAMIQALVLAFLVLMGMIQVWHLFILASFLGVINAFDMPIRQSFVVDMLQNREDLGNAIALNSFLFNGARLVGPSVAGILIGVSNEGICFLINGISFVAVLIALLCMKIKPRELAITKNSIVYELKNGFRYVRDSLPIKYILLNIALLSLMGMPFAVLLPVFARDILKGGPETLGFLMASSGVGAIAGALFLASRKSISGLGKLISASSAMFSIGIITFALSRSVILSSVLLIMIGFGMMIQMVASNTILQITTQENMRGRVMSFFAMSFAGTMPFGSLYAGVSASFIGAPMTLIISGMVCLFGSFIFYRRFPSMNEFSNPA